MSLWRNGDFLRLWYGQVVSTIGSSMSRLALPLLVLALTGSPVQAGLIGAAQNLPYLVLGLPAGALLDRWNRKTVMIACDTARLLAFGSVPVAWYFGHLTLAHLYAVALIHGAALVFFNIAQLAALPQVVPVRQLAEAHSLNTASEGIASLFGPSVAGALIRLAATTEAGAALAYLIDSVSYGISVFSLATIGTRFQSDRTAAPLSRLPHQVLEGLRFLWARVDLRLLIMVNSLHRMCFAPVQLAVVLLATEALHGDAGTAGLLFSTAGAGGLAASAVTPWLRRRVSVGHSMLGLMVCHALGLAVTGAAPVLPVAAAGMFLAGMMENMTGIVQVSYRLGVIPDALQGRVNSSYRLFSYIGVTAGTAIGGVLLEAYGARATLGSIAAAIALIAAGIAISPLRRL